jgi:hypothetical protein
VSESLLIEEKEIEDVNFSSYYEDVYTYSIAFIFEYKESLQEPIEEED